MPSSSLGGIERRNRKRRKKVSPHSSTEETDDESPQSTLSSSRGSHILATFRCSSSSGRHTQLSYNAYSRNHTLLEDYNHQEQIKPTKCSRKRDDNNMTSSSSSSSSRALMKQQQQQVSKRRSHRSSHDHLTMSTDAITPPDAYTRRKIIGVSIPVRAPVRKLKRKRSVDLESVSLSREESPFNSDSPFCISPVGLEQITRFGELYSIISRATALAGYGDMTPDAVFFSGSESESHTSLRSCSEEELEDLFDEESDDVVFCTEPFPIAEKTSRNIWRRSSAQHRALEGALASNGMYGCVHDRHANVESSDEEHTYADVRKVKAELLNIVRRKVLPIEEESSVNDSNRRKKRKSKTPSRNVSLEDAAAGALPFVSEKSKSGKKTSPRKSPRQRVPRNAVELRECFVPISRIITPPQRAEFAVMTIDSDESEGEDPVITNAEVIDSIRKEVYNKFNTSKDSSGPESLLSDEEDLKKKYNAEILRKVAQREKQRQEREKLNDCDKSKNYETESVAAITVGNLPTAETVIHTGVVTVTHDTSTPMKALPVNIRDSISLGNCDRGERSFVQECDVSPLKKVNVIPSLQEPPVVQEAQEHDEELESVSEAIESPAAVDESNEMREAAEVTEDIEVAPQEPITIKTVCKNIESNTVSRCLSSQISQCGSYSPELDARLWNKAPLASSDEFNVTDEEPESENVEIFKQKIDSAVESLEAKMNSVDFSFTKQPRENDDEKNKHESCKSSTSRSSCPETSNTDILRTGEASVEQQAINSPVLTTQYEETIVSAALVEAAAPVESGAIEASSCELVLSDIAQHVSTSIMTSLPNLNDNNDNDILVCNVNAIAMDYNTMDYYSSMCTSDSEGTCISIEEALDYVATRQQQCVSDSEADKCENKRYFENVGDMSSHDGRDHQEVTGVINSEIVVGHRSRSSMARRSAVNGNERCQSAPILKNRGRVNVNYTDEELAQMYRINNEEYQMIFEALERLRLPLRLNIPSSAQVDDRFAAVVEYTSIPWQLDCQSDDVSLSEPTSDDIFEHILYMARQCHLRYPYMIMGIFTGRENVSDIIDLIRLLQRNWRFGVKCIYTNDKIKEAVNRLELSGEDDFMKTFDDIMFAYICILSFTLYGNYTINHIEPQMDKMFICNAITFVFLRRSWRHLCSNAFPQWLVKCWHLSRPCRFRKLNMLTMALITKLVSVPHDTTLDLFEALGDESIYKAKRFFINNHLSIMTTLLRYMNESTDGNRFQVLRNICSEQNLPDDDIIDFLRSYSEFMNERNYLDYPAIAFCLEEMKIAFEEMRLYARKLERSTRKSCDED